MAQDKAVTLSEPVVTIKVPDVTVDNADVFIDDLQANNFTKFNDGVLTVNLPFTEATEPFRISILSRASGTELFAGTYRLGSPEARKFGIFDTVERSGSFQNDLVYKINSRRKPRDTADDRDVANDFRAAGSFTGVRNDWKLQVDGEVVGTDDDAKTLRPGKSKYDVSNGKGGIEFDNGSVFAGLSVGDVQMSGSNQLVTSGFGSRGVIFETRLFEDRLSITAGNIYGTGIVGAQRGLTAYNHKNRRSALDVKADVIRGDKISLKLHGSLLDVVRPGEIGFNVGGVPENSEANTVTGAGFDLGLFNDRIHYLTNFGWSKYENADDFSGNFGATEDDAVDHQINVGLWRGDDLVIDAYGLYSLVKPLYISVEGGAQADRNTRESGVTVNWRMISVDAAYNVFDNNVNDIGSILTTRQATSSSTVSINLDEFRDTGESNTGETDNKAGKGDSLKGEKGFSFIRLLPSSVSFNGSQSRIKALNADTVVLNSSIAGSEIPSQVTTTLGLGFSWNWENNASTSINLSRSQLDTRQAGRDTADTDDKSIDVSHTFSGEIWDASVRIALIDTRNKETTTKSTDKRYETGVSFAIRPEKLPDFFTSYDFSVLASDFEVDQNTSLTNSWRLQTSLDFTKYIPEGIGDVQPYAKVNYQIGDTNTRDPNSGFTSQFDYSLTLAVGFQY